MAAAAYNWLLEHPWSGRVRLRPHAVSLDPDCARRRDAVWLCAPTENGGVRVHNTRTGHFIDLLPKDVCRIDPDTDSPNDGLAHAVLTLARRPVLRGAGLWRRKRSTCRRRSNIDPPCRSNTDPGMDAGRVTANCGQV